MTILANTALAGGQIFQVMGQYCEYYHNTYEYCHNTCEYWAGEYTQRLYSLQENSRDIIDPPKEFSVKHDQTKTRSIKAVDDIANQIPCKDVGFEHEQYHVKKIKMEVDGWP